MRLLSLQAMGHAFGVRFKAEKPWRFTRANRSRDAIRDAISGAKILIIKGGSSSVVERQLPKLNVAGSIPASRSKINLP